MAKLKHQNSNYRTLVAKTFQEKFPSLLTGLTVIVAIVIVLGLFIKNRLPSSVKKEATATQQTAVTQEPTPAHAANTYVVQKGDHLWMIAEKTYGSGYNAYDIAKANNIENPSLVYAGQKLVLPVVTPKAPTVGEIAPASTQKVTLTVSKYTVQKGDYLWKIALEAYGDGYAWTRIAKANNLANPNLIFSGNVLDIPK